ncbi:GIY-YIG nuclease family protein, partial [Pseudochelatococcus lubricantis]|uniref:GIY-YIG nuclease family protein n=1 Tax=Pseudochelatococcus lubricantis TaxID=1538102 RepID=UPI0035E62C47
PKPTTIKPKDSRYERGTTGGQVTMCKAYLNENPVTHPKPPTPDISQIGHVYMIQYGKDYKIGRTFSLSRRSREIQIELPETTKFIHSILTDDPVGFENYWHRRFSEYRKNGEWFRLPPKAVTAFKRWKKIA